MIYREFHYMLKKARIYLLVFAVSFSIPACKNKQKVVELTKEEQQLKKIMDKETAEVEFKINFSEANKFKMLGEEKTAMELFSKCIELNPQSAVARYELAQILFNKFEVEAAKELILEAVKLNDKNKWYRALLARTYVSSGQTEKAIGEYTYLIEHHPNDEEYYRVLGSLYTDAGKYTEALDVYSKAENAITYSNSIGYSRLRIYKSQGNRALVLSEYKKMVESNPYNENIMQELANEAEKDGNIDVAVDTYLRIIKLSPNDVRTREKLLNYYIAEKQTDKAIDQYTHILDNARIDVQKKRSHYRRILDLNLNEPQNKRLAQMQQKYPEVFNESEPENPSQNTDVQKLYDEVLLAPQNVKSWYTLLEKCNETQQFDLMYKYGSEAIELFPNMPFLYYYTGFGALKTSKINEAKENLEAGKSIVVDDDAMLKKFDQLIADVYVEMKNFSEAYPIFDQLLAQDADNTTLLHKYAQALANEGTDFAKAQTMIDKCRKIAPSNSFYTETKALLLFKMGEYENAKKMCEENLATTLNTRASLAELYGDILFKTGNTKEAVKQWKVAVGLGNNSAKLSKKISTETYID